MNAMNDQRKMRKPYLHQGPRGTKRIAPVSPIAPFMLFNVLARLLEIESGKRPTQENIAFVAGLDDADMRRLFRFEISDPKARLSPASFERACRSSAQAIANERAKSFFLDLTDVFKKISIQTRPDFWQTEVFRFSHSFSSQPDASQKFSFLKKSIDLMIGDSDSLRVELEKILQDYTNLMYSWSIAGSYEWAPIHGASPCKTALLPRSKSSVLIEPVKRAYDLLRGPKHHLQRHARESDLAVHLSYAMSKYAILGDDCYNLEKRKEWDKACKEFDALLSHSQQQL